MFNVIEAVHLKRYTHFQECSIRNEMSLIKLLTKIQQGKPINVDSLRKAMPNNIDWRDMFDASQMVANNKYKVTVIDNKKFSVLLEQSQLPASRAQAARHKFVSSHSVACDSAYMLCFPVQSDMALGHNNSNASGALGANALARNLLSVASVNKQALPSLFISAKNAILIENQDCFFQWQAFTSHFQSSIDIHECDVFFAGGKRILNNAFAPFLQQYEHLYCAFDYDLDGLKMAQNLVSKAHTKTYILLPDTLNRLSSLFVFEPQNLTKLIDAQRICKEMGLIELHNIFSTTKHFMEQEALLNITKPS